MSTTARFRRGYTRQNPIGDKVRVNIIYDDEDDYRDTEASRSLWFTCCCCCSLIGFAILMTLLGIFFFSYESELKEIDTQFMNTSDDIMALQAKDMILMMNVSDLSDMIVSNDVDITALQAKDVVLMDKDMALMDTDMMLESNLTMANAMIANLKDENMMQQAEIDAVTLVGQMLQNDTMNINVTLFQAIADAMALSDQVDVVFNKSCTNTLDIASNVNDIDALEANTFTSVALQAPATGGYSAMTTSNVLKFKPGTGISLAVDGVPSVVVSNTGVWNLLVGVQSLTGAITLNAGNGLTATVIGNAITLDVTFPASTGIQTIDSTPSGDSVTPNGANTVTYTAGDGVEIDAAGANNMRFQSRMVDGINTVATLVNTPDGSAYQIDVMANGTSGITGLTGEVGGTTTGTEITIDTGKDLKATRTGDTINIHHDQESGIVDAYYCRAYNGVLPEALGSGDQFIFMGNTKIRWVRTGQVVHVQIDMTENQARSRVENPPNTDAPDGTYNYPDFPGNRALFATRFVNGGFGIQLCGGTLSTAEMEFKDTVPGLADDVYLCTEGSLGCPSHSDPANYCNLQKSTLAAPNTKPCAGLPLPQITGLNVGPSGYTNSQPTPSTYAGPSAIRQRLHVPAAFYDGTPAPIPTSFVDAEFEIDFTTNSAVLYILDGNSLVDEGNQRIRTFSFTYLTSESAESD